MGEFDFDVIVVGSGMSGGWVAKEMCEKGFKTLVLDRGHPLKHKDGYITESKSPWEMPNRGYVGADEAGRYYEHVRKSYAFSEFTKHNFIIDQKHPYEVKDGKRFDWIRSANVGGKSVIWGRHCYRLSPMDFEANKQDGHGCDWPIRYEDLEKWYGYVETFAGISGSKENLPQLPDGIFQKPFEMNPVELDAKRKIEAKFPGRRMIIGRCANLTEPTELQMELGREECRVRDECPRGCSWGGYFSSLSASLPAAERTGNLTLLPNAMVQKVLYDPKTRRATGVQLIDTVHNKCTEITARVVFMCASTLSTAHILLNSRSETFPAGIGNTSGVLGHYLMDHVVHAGAAAEVVGYDDLYYKGRRPTNPYIPRFKNITEYDVSFLRGYGFQGGASRDNWRASSCRQGIGETFKNSIRKPGKWRFWLGGFGEMLPNFDNHISLHATKTDAWGMPLLEISCAYGENEKRMKEDMKKTAVEMLEVAGFKNVRGIYDEAFPGIAVHEMGLARMGMDPSESYLNKYNQSHEVDNLFVTDGAAMTSSPCQNPSLTLMALSARAANYVADQMKERRI